MDDIRAHSTAPTDRNSDFTMAPPVPSETYADMPTQAFWNWQAAPSEFPDTGRLQALWRRGMLFAGTLLLSLSAIYAMYEVMAVNDLTNVQILILILFAPNFTWISFLSLIHI